MTDSLRAEVERRMRVAANDAASACKCIPEDSIGPNGNVPLLCVPCAVDVAVAMLSERVEKLEAELKLPEHLRECDWITTAREAEERAEAAEKALDEQRERWGHVIACHCHATLDVEEPVCALNGIHLHPFDDPRCAPPTRRME